jgi:hypothetical protein
MFIVLMQFFKGTLMLLGNVHGFLIEQFSMGVEGVGGAILEVE